MPGSYLSTVTFPTQSSSRNWQLCSIVGCTGEQAPNHGACYSHLSGVQRAQYLHEVAFNDAALTLSGQTISGQTLAAIIGAMPVQQDNASGAFRPLLPSQVFCDETNFVDYFDLQHAVFAQHASFQRAKFSQGLIWNGCHFNGGLDLSQAEATGPTNMGHLVVSRIFRAPGLQCENILSLFGLQLDADLDLRWARCAGIWLSDAAIGGNVLCSDASFAHGETADGLRRNIARFDGIQITGDMDFTNCRLSWETTFNGYADSKQSSFGEFIKFHGAVLGNADSGGRHLLTKARISSIDLSDVTIYGRISFAESTFARRLNLDNLKIRQPLQAQVEDENSHYFGDAALDLSQIETTAGARLIGVEVMGSVQISMIGSDCALEIVSLASTQSVRVESSIFAYFPAHIKAGGGLIFSRCQFNNGGTIICSSFQVSFLECDSRQPMTVGAISGEVAPSLRSLTGTNLEHFVAAGVDLSMTIFSGSVGLRNLAIEGASTFARSPLKHGASRQVIQDEVQLRAKTSRSWSSILYGGESESSVTPEGAVAAYRSLRKGREDRGDQPGSSDFYYGEMEMRRIASPKVSVERILLTLHWIGSGYALRAWRPTIFLVLVVTLTGSALSKWGYTTKVNPGKRSSILELLKVSLGLEKSPDGLTQNGSVIIIAARLLIPALLALSLFALRGRIKR